MRTQRFLAVLLAATMVFGSTITAFAGDEAGTGSASGTGAAEGYVPATVVKVTVPTTTATTFAYTMDPQRLLAQTNGARTGGWEAIENDTGVYFKTADGYANTSDTVYFINKCSDKAIYVHVKAAVAATAGTNDIGLVAKAAVPTTGEAKLYLGLNVTGTATNIAYGTAAEAYVKALAPTNAQYEITYANKKYDKTEIAGATFNAIPIQLEGAVSDLKTNSTMTLEKGSSTTAPKVDVTWEWQDEEFEDKTSGTTGVKQYVTKDYYTLTGATASKGTGIVGGNPKADATITPTAGSSSIVLTFPDEVVDVKFDNAAIDKVNVKQSGNTITISNKRAVKTDPQGWWGTQVGKTVVVTFADNTPDDLSNNPTLTFTAAAEPTN
jgi:hypothetical protein